MMRQTDAARLEKERLARKEAARRAKVSHSLHPVGRVAHPLGLFFFLLVAFRSSSAFRPPTRAL